MVTGVLLGGELASKSEPFIICGDGFCTVLIVKGQDDFVIVHINRIEEAIYQPFPPLLFGGVYGAETAKPASVNNHSAGQF